MEVCIWTVQVINFSLVSSSVWVRNVTDPICIIYRYVKGYCCSDCLWTVIAEALQYIIEMGHVMDLNWFVSLNFLQSARFLELHEEHYHSKWLYCLNSTFPLALLWTTMLSTLRAPHHSHMRTKESRLGTYYYGGVVWPRRTIRAQPHILAEAGLFYIGNKHSKSLFNLEETLTCSCVKRTWKENLKMMNLVTVQQACTTQKARRAKLININSPRAAKVYFVIVWKKFWKDK